MQKNEALGALDTFSAMFEKVRTGTAFSAVLPTAFLGLVDTRRMELSIPQGTNCVGANGVCVYRGCLSSQAG